MLDAELVAATLVLGEPRNRAGLGERRADPDPRLRLDNRYHTEPQRQEDNRESRPADRLHGRWLHGGVGKRAFTGAGSSGQTIALFLPSCQWKISALWAI